uniref:Uncharacterized protein n=1 Tax=Hyaloperonospora arabidopsidis (strain Emoy2) TaxID=559515 RepID=M4BPJ2_HYAAE
MVYRDACRLPSRRHNVFLCQGDDGITCPLLCVVCNGVPPLHDIIHEVNIKYEYYVRTNIIFSQYWLNKQYDVAEVIHCSLIDVD